MYAQLFSSLVLFTFIISNYAKNDEQFLECRHPFKCGDNEDGYTYPFYGEGRPSYCGLKGFELKCHENVSVTIYNGMNMTFSVVQINQTSREIRIVHDDVIHRDVNDCVTVDSITYPNTTLFGFNPNTEIINVFYDCPAGLDVNLSRSLVWSNFSCVNNGVQSDAYYAGESFSGAELRAFQLCKIPTKIPVLRTAFEAFRNDESMTIVQLLKQGFVVDYQIDEVACSACVNSSGLCGSDSADSGRFQCICHDGAHPFSCPNPGTESSYRMKIGIGIGAVLIAILLVGFMCCCRKSLSSTFVTLLRTKTKNDKDIEAFIKQHGFSTPRRYKFNDLRRITCSFKHELGKGGYGNVYKGTLPDGRVVAIKVLKVSKGNGDDFINEVSCIGKTSHVNVVKLLGFCCEGNKRALIYEFMPNGSLEKFIYSKTSASENHVLGWAKLYDIALGIAHGLEYLHRGCSTRILHFDIKPHNILLDEDFAPKISDFGLAKLFTTKQSIISTMEARGTIGYIAPEVISRHFGGVSHKSDVYSYGMMVLEMAGGRKNVDIGVVHSSEIYFPH